MPAAFRPVGPQSVFALVRYHIPNVCGKPSGITCMYDSDIEKMVFEGGSEIFIRKNLNC